MTELDGPIGKADLASQLHDHLRRVRQRDKLRAKVEELSTKRDKAYMAAEKAAEAGRPKLERDLIPESKQLSQKYAQFQRAVTKCSKEWSSLRPSVMTLAYGNGGTIGLREFIRTLPDHPTKEKVEILQKILVEIGSTRTVTAPNAEAHNSVVPNDLTRTHDEDLYSLPIKHYAVDPKLTGTHKNLYSPATSRPRGATEREPMKLDFHPSEGDAYASNDRAQAAQILKEARKKRGLGASRLVKEIRAHLKGKGSKLKGDRSTFYRTMNGTTRPGPEMQTAFTAVLQLTQEEVELISRGLGWK